MKRERCQIVTVESRCGDQVVARVHAEFPMTPETRKAVEAVILAAAQYVDRDPMRARRAQ